MSDKAPSDASSTSSITRSISPVQSLDLSRHPVPPHLLTPALLKACHDSANSSRVIFTNTCRHEHFEPDEVDWEVTLDSPESHRLDMDIMGLQYSGDFAARSGGLWQEDILSYLEAEFTTDLPGGNQEDDLGIENELETLALDQRTYQLTVLIPKTRADPETRSGPDEEADQGNGVPNSQIEEPVCSDQGLHLPGSSRTDLTMTKIHIADLSHVAAGVLEYAIDDPNGLAQAQSFSDVVFSVQEIDYAHPEEETMYLRKEGKGKRVEFSVVSLVKPDEKDIVDDWEAQINGTSQ